MNEVSLHFAKMGRKGGKARAASLSKKRMSEIGRKGGNAPCAPGKKRGRPKKYLARNT